MALPPIYDPAFVQPMRDELTAVGVQELTTPADVDAALAQPGTTLVFVNSVCGCAAGSARPGLRLALQHSVQPDRVVSVFAGMEREAVDRARSYFLGYPPSSPQIALLRDGNVIHMIQRHHIEGRSAEMIAENLADAFNTHCAVDTAAN
ncbi:MAG: BrxA/BrxB family bacilliredoxin [Chlorobi bacterium]|nr:BrxA/BrxB family bacilliredoxin [Chlorobiota bacterium]MBX7216317.1 BrxA/BrxB family bacilliredoxin [Candidatus Kapabacteria bacterium]MCE7933338.1 BrxA/BrxB family bacilliredoxin [Chlorobi bacterium CHB2]